MAKSRYGRKRGKTVRRKSGRRKGGRRAAGHRLARYNQEARRIGKSAAYALVFGGHRGHGKKRKKSGRRGGGRRHGLGRGGVSKHDYRVLLAQIQDANKTTGWPATPEEKQAAYETARLWGTPRTGTKRSSPEEALRNSLRSRLERDKKAAAQQLVAIRRRERQADKARREREEAEREVSDAMRAL